MKLTPVKCKFFALNPSEDVDSLVIVKDKRESTVLGIINEPFYRALRRLIKYSVDMEKQSEKWKSLYLEAIRTIDFPPENTSVDIRWYNFADDTIMILRNCTYSVEKGWSDCNGTALTEGMVMKWVLHPDPRIWRVHTRSAS